jgi:hypothetical protein
VHATPPDAATATPDSETTIDSLVDGRAAEHTPLFLAVAQVAAGGAAFGALSGFTLVATLIVVAPGAPILAAIPVGVLFGATFGAACGAILAPALGFSLFRDIPLWRLYTYSAAGTVLGGLLAALVRTDFIVGAFGGLAAALGLLRLRARYRA